MTVINVPEEDTELKIHSGSESCPLLKSFKQKTSRPKLKLYPVHSSDTSRFPTLERLENSMLLSKNSKLTIEPVLFNSDNNIINNNSIITNSKKGGSQSDSKSIHSTKSNSTIRKKRQVKKKNQSTPTEIFARNLSEAVLDVDDSLDDGYVYNNTSGTGLYPALLSPPAIPSFETSVNCKSYQDNNSYFSDHHHKFRRPGLRSTVSELPTRVIKSFYLESLPSKFEKRNYSYRHQDQPHYRYSSSGEEDEENAPLLHYSSSKLKKERYIKNKSCWCTCISVFLVLFTCIVFIGLAKPLTFVEITSISSVLGTQKQLIFDLHVRARNSNNWSIQMSHSSFSVFAASHYVPITSISNKNDTTHDKKIHAKTRQVEYLGTVNHLVDPLLFKPAFYFEPVTSNSTSQIQINNPGETEGDITGNERWYPYELTIRGVLKYQILPSFLSSKVFSARVCKIIEVDPFTGIVKDVPFPEQSICNES